MIPQRPETRASRPAWIFQRRAGLYAQLDSVWCDRTRFFGAAHRTNRVLASLASVGCGFGISQTTCTWLAEVGGSLETANLRIAARLPFLQQTGLGLDLEIVCREQLIVERALEVSQSRRADLHARILAELDGILNRRHWSGFLHLNRDLRDYLPVLAAVRRQLSAPIRFSSRVHREAVGAALIQQLRQEQQRVQAFMG